jgi:ATP-dependent DNA ligase
LVFPDLLHLSGVDLQPAQFLKRGSAGKLARRLADAIRYAEHLIDDSNALFRKSCLMSLEGVISKRAEFGAVIAR